jgi:hypothetical protein
MTARLVNDIAAIIREVDGDNKLSPADLGATLATRLIPFYSDLYAEDVIAFVERANPDKRMGAGRLAELLVAEFDLDKEN